MADAVQIRDMDAPPITLEARLQRIAVLEQTVATLHDKNRLLQDENRPLREQLEQQQRTRTRQAAPFRRRNRKTTGRLSEMRRKFNSVRVP